MTDTIATYRLQFNADFGFARAAAIVPYLADLGISHIYASPIFRARPGSAHGYDGVDPNRLNPELGAPRDWEALVAARQDAGLGWLQDIVPNHMAFHADNGMLADVLEHGRHSRFFDFFDIDWRYPDDTLQGRVMAPFLGERYGEVLQQGHIRIAFGAEGYAAVVYDAFSFPLAIETYLLILDHAPAPAAAVPADDDPDGRRVDALEALESLGIATDAGLRRRQSRAVKQTLWQLYQENGAFRKTVDGGLDRLNGRPGDMDSFRRLDHLLSRQHFRLCWWKNANEEINYRRFFDINELIALRQEDPAVFAHTHGLTAEMTGAGRFSGVRIDHVDGLAEPGPYLHRLRERLGDEATILVEKILAPEEALPPDWPVQGTTGYDAGHWLNALFVQREHEADCTAVYKRFTGRTASFADVVRRAKEEILETRLAGDLTNLARRMQPLAAEASFAGHLTRQRLEAALSAILTRFPIYRTYLGEDSRRSADEAALSDAVSRAENEAPHLGTEIGFIHQVLLDGEDCRRSDAEAHRRAQRLDAVRSFQQLSAALMAKGCEDTAFYRYHRLLSLNEVGGEPDAFGCRRAHFHAFMGRRAESWPRAMNSTATHDSKRGEDVRARLNVLSEIPGRWGRRLDRWRDLTWHFRRTDGEPVPDENTACLLFQTLLGAWPAGDDEPTAAFVGRIQDYMVKAVREAGEATSWIDPREDYEAALTTFVERILAPSLDNPFLADFTPFCREIAFFGRFNALSQCLLKITVPGVPDFYQGTELPQFVLVDPDNRRPVAYDAAKRLLGNLRDREDPLTLAAELVEKAADGRIKLYLIARSLAARKQCPALFLEGDYRPLETDGAFARHAAAFAREFRGQWALVLVPRFLTALVDPPQAPLGPAVWQDTVVHLPSGGPRSWYNPLTRERLPGGAQLDVGDLLAHFPAALLMSEEVA